MRLLAWQALQDNSQNMVTTELLVANFGQMAGNSMDLLKGRMDLWYINAHYEQNRLFS